MTPYGLTATILQALPLIEWKTRLKKLTARKGIVNLGWMDWFQFVDRRWPRSWLGCCNGSPDREGSRSQEPVIGRSQQVVPSSEKVLDDTVDRQESLCLAGRLESTHVPLFSFCGDDIGDEFESILGVIRGIILAKTFA